MENNCNTVTLTMYQNFVDPKIEVMTLATSISFLFLRKMPCLPKICMKIKNALQNNLIFPNMFINVPRFTIYVQYTEFGKILYCNLSGT